MERKITIEESVPYTEDYQNKMLEENQVEGLLEMHGRGMDDKSCYDYDVSGKVSMKALYEKHTMSGEEIKILLKSILRVVKEVERYLLNVNCILMDPEYIFYTEEKYYFCYYPPKEKSLWERFHHLSEYLVKCADYQDKECVQIVFLLHKETMKENYSLEQIIFWQRIKIRIWEQRKKRKEAHILTGQNMTGSQARKWEVRYSVRQKTCGHR